jgi:hypothetical protein
MQNQDIDLKIVEKIKKCLALSKNPNEHEAALAAARAQELLVKYNLAMADVEGINASAIEEIFLESEDGDYEEWKRVLLHAVASCNYCRFILIHGRDKGKLIGKPKNMIVTLEIFSYCVEAIERLLEESGLRGKVQKYSFCKGAVNAIYANMLEKKKQLESQGVDGCSSTAVMVVDKENTKAVKEYIAEHIGAIRRSNTNKKIDYGCFDKGYSEGKRISLNDQIR